MGGHLTLIVPLIALVGKLDVQAPVIGMLVVQRVTGVAGIRVEAVRDEMQLVVLTASPRYLHKQNTLQVYVITTLTPFAVRLRSVTALFNKATNVKCFCMKHISYETTSSTGL
jgi:hypothetical protein